MAYILNDADWYVIGGINLEIKLITKPPITQQSADEGFRSF
jgi:hypothetical protein